MSRKSLTLFALLALLIGLLMSAQIAAGAGFDDDPGADTRPLPHPPQCKVFIGRAYTVTCLDEYGDINDALIIFRGDPLKHRITWDGERAVIVVYLSPLDYFPYEQQFIWCVGDAQGNMVFGSYPGPG